MTSAIDWNDSAYPPEALRCSFGDRARDDDRERLDAFAEGLEEHRWIVAPPEPRDERGHAPALIFATYTVQAPRRHDDPSAELRVLAEARWLVGELATWSGRLKREVELALEDEPIGWIVRGEVSDELARFLDRWERALKDHVALRAAPRVDPHAGYVSVWLGELRDHAELDALLVQAAPARSPLRRALGLRSLPGGAMEASFELRGTVRDLLAPVSFSASFIDAAVAAAEANGLTAATAAVVYYDHAHDPADALPAQKGARLRFCGAFPYDDATRAQADVEEEEAMPEALAAKVGPWRHYIPRLHEHWPATTARIEALERALGAELPADYRTFLQPLGGASASAGDLVSPVEDNAWPRGPVSISQVIGFGADGGPALDPHGRIPFDLLPIAHVDGGDWICLGLGGRYRGEVWLWAHDAPRSAPRDTKGPWLECLYRVAPTFATFVDGLTLRPDPDVPLVEPAGVEAAAVVARSRAIAAQVGARKARSPRPRVVQAHPVATGAFARLVAEAPDVALGVVRGAVPVSDADAIDVPEVAAHIAHALWADAEVRNGGFSQLIGNGGPSLVARSLAALRALDLVRAAAILARAVEGDDDDENLEEFDLAWYELDPSVVAAVVLVLATQAGPWFERLAAHPDVRARVATMTSAARLEVAIDLGDLARVQRLLAAEPSALTPALVAHAVAQRSTLSRIAIAEHLLRAAGREELQALLGVAIGAVSPGMVALLLRHGARATADPETGVAPLASARDVETATLLLAAGASARAVDHAGRTALHTASSYELVSVLLGAGADARVVSAAGETVLHHALDAAAIDRLVEYGAEPNQEDAAGITPLMRQHDPESMAALAKHGARYDAFDHAGRTALHHHASDRCTQHLLDVGLHPLRPDSSGETPLGLARAKDSFGGRYVRMLEEAAGIEPEESEAPVAAEAPATQPVPSAYATLAVRVLELLRDGEHLALAADADRDALVRDLAAALAEGEVGSLAAFAAWLTDRPDVDEVFATDAELATCWKQALAEQRAR